MILKSKVYTQLSPLFAAAVKGRGIPVFENNKTNDKIMT